MSVEIVFRGPARSGKRAVAELVSRLLQGGLDVALDMTEETGYEGKDAAEVTAMVLRKVAEGGGLTVTFEKTEE